MLIIFTRALIIYVFLLIAMRIMGKKQLGELQPFEFAITLIVADLACIPMGDTTVPISYGLVPIFTLMILHVFLNKINKHSVKIRRIINGKPVIIIDGQGLNLKALSSLDMTVNDVMEAIRTAGFFNLCEIRYAIVETNGTVTVLPKSGYAPATLNDLNIEKPEPNLPYSLICEGKVMEDNIKKSGFTKENFEKVLAHYGYKAKEILIMSVTDKQEIFLQPKNKPCIITAASEIDGINQEANAA